MIERGAKKADVLEQDIFEQSIRPKKGAFDASQARLIKQEGPMQYQQSKLQKVSFLNTRSLQREQKNTSDYNAALTPYKISSMNTTLKPGTRFASSKQGRRSFVEEYSPILKQSTIISEISNKQDISKTQFKYPIQPGVAENILIHRQFKNKDLPQYQGLFKPSLFQKKVLDFQDKFYTNRRQALLELYASLDKDIAQKPFKMMANVVVQAVLVDDFDIDTALQEYHEYLLKKYQRQGKEKEIEKARLEAVRQRNLLQEQLEQRAKKAQKMLRKRGHQTTDQELMEDQQDFSLPQNPQGQDEQTLSLKTTPDEETFSGTTEQNIQSKTEDVEKVEHESEEEDLGEDEYRDNGEFNQDFLRLMHFRALVKKTKSSKITQAETISQLLQDLEKQKQQNLKHTDYQDLQGSSQQNILQNTSDQAPLTLESALNPMNAFYKKQVKKQIQQQKAREANPNHKPQQVLERANYEKSVLDQGVNFVAGEYVQGVVNKMQEMKYDYKAQFNLQKIALKQQEEKVRREQMKAAKEARNKAATQAAKEREKKKKKEESDDDKESKKSNSEDKKSNVKASQDILSSLQNLMAPKGGRREVEGGSNKSPQKNPLASMKTMVSKHKTKFMTMGALNQINKEAYGKDYQANIEKILKEGTLELFLDPRQRKKKLQNLDKNLDQAESQLQTVAEGQNEEGVLPKAMQIGGSPQPITGSQSKQSSCKNSSRQGSSSSGKSQGDSGNTPIPRKARPSKLVIRTEKSAIAVGARRHGIQGADVQDFRQMSQQSKEQKRTEEAIQYISGFLAGELERIRNERARELAKLEQEQISMAELQKNTQGTKNAIKPAYNTKVTELYQGLSRKENVNKILKNGENPYFDPFAVTNAFDKSGQESLSLEQVILKHERESVRAGLVALPLAFSSIQGNRLALSGYNISNQAAGISRALTLNRNGLCSVQQLILDGCSLKDKGFSLILKGILAQEWIERICYSNDEFGPQSLAQLEEIEQREASGKTPKPLRELHFCSLKISETVKIGLIKTIKDFAQLRRLKVSGINLSSAKVFEQVIKCVEIAQAQTQDLDLSNCFFSPPQLLDLSVTLMENKYLFSLNLSNNSICTSNPELQETFCENISTFARNNPNLVLLRLSAMNLGSKALLVLKREGLEQSKSLQSVHLSGNNFDRDTLYEFEQMVGPRRGVCQDAHTNHSLNQIEEEKRQEGQQEVGKGVGGNFVKGMKSVRENHLDLKTFVKKESFAVKFLRGALRQDEAEKAKEAEELRTANRAFLVNQQLSERIKEQVQISEALTFDGFRHSPYLADQMVFTRRLGYQELIIDKRIDPKSQTLENPHGYNSNASSLWQAEKAERDCFVCNKSQMVTLFFRRQHLEEDFQLITNEVTRQACFGYYGLDKYREANPTQPFVFGTLTQWRGFKMTQALHHALLHLGVAAEKQSQGKERIFKEVETLRAGLISRLNSGSGGISGAQVAVKAFGWAAYLLDLIERQHKSGESLIVNFPYMRQDFVEISKHVLGHIDRELKKHRQANDIVGDSEKKKPRRGKKQKSNSPSPDRELEEPLKELDPSKDVIRFEREEADDVFIYSDFVRPGVHTVLVYDPVTNNLYHKQVGVELRVPPPKTAGSGTKDSEAAKRREQLLQESTELAMRKQVFNDFKTDNTSIIKLSFLKDTHPSNFKPYKFMASQIEINACLAVFVQNFKGLKDTYLVLAAKSGCYPNIDEAHIVSFCKENGLIDSEFTEEDLKDIYYAANVEYAEDEDDNNPDHLLNRKEFFELFLRISVAKFTVLKTDGITRASEGFQNLVDQVLLPVSDNLRIREFRLERCHGDTEVCGILLKNSLGIRKLYSQFMTRSTIRTAGIFTNSSAQNMLRIALISAKDISDEDVKVLFAISKMTVIDEMSDRQRYFSMEFTEFMEFICRVADHLYQPKSEESDDQTLKSISQSLQKLLSNLLTLVGCQLKGLNDQFNDIQ